jgi:arsenate reductase (glutaredoxin)
MLLYTYRNCDTCRKAVRFLEERGLAFEQRPIREQPPTREELGQMLGHCGGDLRKLFNTAGGDYRELNLRDRLPTMTRDEALELLAQRGNLIKRPFLLGKGFGLVGFDAAAWTKQLE